MVLSAIKCVLLSLAALSGAQDGTNANGMDNPDRSPAAAPLIGKSNRSRSSSFLWWIVRSPYMHLTIVYNHSCRFVLWWLLSSFYDHEERNKRCHPFSFCHRRGKALVNHVYGCAMFFVAASAVLVGRKGGVAQEKEEEQG